MKNGFLALLVLLCSSMAFAEGGIAGLKWDQPMFNEDGSVLQQAEIDSFELHYVVDGTFAENAKPKIIKASERSYTLEVTLPPKLVPYTIAMGMKTVSIYGTKSKMSNIVVTTFNVKSTKTPQAPVNIRLNISCDTTCKITEQTVETLK